MEKDVAILKVGHEQQNRDVEKDNYQPKESEYSNLDNTNLEASLSVKLVTIPIEIFVLAVWAIVGLVFWLPFLVRMIAIYIAAVLVSAGGANGIPVALAGLEKAVKFYPEGFVQIRSSMKSIYQGKVDKNVTWDQLDDFWWPLATHVISALVFWSVTLIALGKLINQA